MYDKVQRHSRLGKLYINIFLPLPENQIATRFLVLRYKILVQIQQT